MQFRLRYRNFWKIGNFWHLWHLGSWKSFEFAASDIIFIKKPLSECQTFYLIIIHVFLIGISHFEKLKIFDVFDIFGNFKSLYFITVEKNVEFAVSDFISSKIFSMSAKYFTFMKFLYICPRYDIFWKLRERRVRERVR